MPLTENLIHRKSSILFVAEDETIERSLNKMTEANVGSILIIKNDTIAGIVTERDVLKNWKKLSNPDTLILPISSLMTSPVFTIFANEMNDAGRIMLEKKIRHLPVIDESKRVLGVISIREALAKALETTPIAHPLETAPLKTPSRKVLNLIAPTGTLESTCKSVLPSHWHIKSWEFISALKDEDTFKKEALKSDAVFFIDIDGLSPKDWKQLLTKFIKLLTSMTQPHVFMVWSKNRIMEEDLLFLKKLAKTASWHAYDRPLAIAMLAKDFEAVG